MRLALNKHLCELLWPETRHISLNLDSTKMYCDGVKNEIQSITWLNYACVEYILQVL